jgi:hypothetical protein
MFEKRKAMKIIKQLESNERHFDWHDLKRIRNLHLAVALIDGKGSQGNAHVIQQAACLFEPFGRTAEPALLNRLAPGRNEYTRFTALRLLKKCGTKKAIPQLLRQLDDESKDIRHEVVETLGELARQFGCGDQITPHFLARLEHEQDIATREAITTWLGEEGDPRANETIRSNFRKNIDSPHAMDRKTVLAYGRLLGEAAVDDLLAILTHPDYPADIRRARERTAGQNRIDSLEVQWADVRNNAITALGEIGSPRAIGTLVDLAENDPHQKTARLALKTVTAMLNIKLSEQAEMILQMMFEGQIEAQPGMPGYDLYEALKNAGRQFSASIT